jgi:hypothetical protein
MINDGVKKVTNRLRWLRWLIFCNLIAIFLGGILLLVSSCSYPLRLDPQRQELQRKQDECLARGGSPKDCRP